MEDKTKQTAEEIGKDIEKEIAKINKPLEKKVKVKIKEYDEIICKRCGKKLNVEKTLTMDDGYRGHCTCDNEDPKCRHRNKVVKTRPADDDYTKLPTGQRVRKVPKSKLNKKQRRKVRALTKSLEV